MKCAKPSYAFALAMHIKDINKTKNKQNKHMGNQSKSYLKPLEIHKKIVRIINFSHFRSHLEPRFC